MIRDTRELMLADKRHFVGLQEFFYLVKVTGPFDAQDPIDTTLYYLEFEHFSKIGITKRDIERRFRGYNLKYKILDSIKLAHKDALYLESRLLGLIDQRYKFRNSDNPMVTRGGHTECFPKIPYNTFYEIITHSILSTKKASAKKESTNNKLTQELAREIYDYNKYEFEDLPPW